MKNNTIPLLLGSMLLLSACCVSADGLGTYSTGFRFGELTKYGVKGIFISSGEGQMMLGNNSSSLSPSDESAFENPWRYSVTGEKMQKRVKESLGSSVILGYTQSHIKYPNVDTDYDVTSVSSLTPHHKEGCITKDYNKGIKSNTTRVGRIVKASTRGTLFNSYEVMIQMGNSGNHFKKLSITVESIYDCAVKFLMSGQKVKVEYAESFINMDITGRETPYDIVSIIPVATLSE